MKPALIAIVGFAGLICVSLYQFYIPLLLVLLNSLAVCLIFGGTLVPVQTRTRRIALHLKFIQNSTSKSNESESSPPCLGGVRIDPNFHSSLEFHLELRNMLRLAFVGVLSLETVAFALRAQANLFSPYSRQDSGEFVMLFLCAFLSVIPLSMAVIWFRERMLLMRAVITIGCLDPRNGAYDFADRTGAGYGGIMKLLRIHPDDNICLVFYSHANPQLNKSSAGLGFHRLVIHRI